MSICLTPKELAEFTGKTERAQKRFGAQQKELEHLGIPYLRRSDKTLIVFRRLVDPGASIKAAETPEPNWDALGPRVEP